MLNLVIPASSVLLFAVFSINFLVVLTSIPCSKAKFQQLLQVWVFRRKGIWALKDAFLHYPNFPSINGTSVQDNAELGMEQNKGQLHKWWWLWNAALSWASAKVVWQKLNHFLHLCSSALHMSSCVVRIYATHFIWICAIYRLCNTF